MTGLCGSPPCVCIILTLVKAAVNSIVILAQWFSSSPRHPKRSLILYFQAVIPDFVLKFSSCRCHRVISFPFTQSGENLGVKFKEPVIHGEVRLTGARDGGPAAVACCPLLSASVAENQRGRLSRKVYRAQSICMGGNALPRIPSGT